jgi:predicted MFS family arabinose efflux permease
MGRGVLGRWLGGYRAAFAQRDLRLLLGALLISATGGWAYNVGLLALLFDRTHSLSWVAVGGLARWIPSLLLSSYAGVIAERTERVRLMLGSDVVCAIWQGLLALVAVTHGPIVLALVLGGLTSVTGLVYGPAVAATIPSVVNEDGLVAANALNGTIDNLAVISGPAVGAVLLLVGSPALAFAVNAGSFVISALLVSRIRARSRPVDVAQAGDGPLRQIAVGFRAILAGRAGRALVAFSALVAFVYGTDTVLLVGVADHRLGTGPEGFGYLLAAIGGGGVLMALVVDRLAASRRLAPTIIAGVAGYTLPTALLTVTHSPGLAIALEVIRGGSTLVVDVLAITALQRAVAPDQVARVFGVFYAVMIGAVALGTVATPIVVSAGGLDTGLLTMAFGPFALGVLGLPALLAVDRDTAATVEALAPRVALLEGLGIFASASRPILERLAAAATAVEFAPGTAIVTEGHEADAIYVLASGEVEVTAAGEKGARPRVLRRMTAPAYFGEIGVLERIPRTATVTAVGDCVCERIDGDAFLNALESTPPSATLIQSARSRLAVTHPSREPSFAQEG